MYIDKIIISNFKNIETAELTFSKKFNYITGNNGEGKTNLLDALYYLSLTKSYFPVTDKQLIFNGSEAMSINGTYQFDDDLREVIAIGIKGSGEKVLKRNGKSISTLSSYIGVIPIVMVSPWDTSLISESGETRRKYLNYILSQTDRDYFRHLISYNHLLAQRNKLLKDESINDDLIETISMQLENHATYIYNCRESLCRDLSVPVKRYYEAISSGKEKIDLLYTSDLQRSTMEQLLIDSYQRDRILKYTSVGVQRDDIDFLMNGQSIKKFGSQGQQKSFLTALKLAQFSLLRQKNGFSPILLLDDLFDRLDTERINSLLHLVSSDEFGQIFITDSNKLRINQIADSIGSSFKSFTVVNGSFITERDEER